MTNLRAVWWIFALRGGFALLFSGLLFFTGDLLGTLFFDPVLLVYLSLLLGFYVLGNGLLFGIAAGFAKQHRLPHWRLLLGEAVFALLLGGYIGISLLMTSHSLALLAGLHALGAGGFQAALALRLRGHRPYLLLLGASGLISMGVGALFLIRHEEPVSLITQWLSWFELFYGVVELAFARAIHHNARAAIASSIGPADAAGSEAG